MRRHAIIFWTAISLAALGCIYAITNPVFLRQLIIPLIIVGIVYLLYRFPPRRLSKRPKVKPSKRTAAKVATQNQPLRKNSHQGKRKQYPFQVIEGQKGKSGDSSDDVPKYH
ncbi:hypothetical protein JCM10914A_38310 [Paenibacillus sp. JCM 10914]|uniref:hypothetical protein n=1 Tax=Paenibacillus sp. JCM 10914 TaxID=1236974 RepID=UPI0003CCA07F|nr:hypothetical protein [Paenibacillus sp. JCM 10914]GAE04542.1 hypothetical protein JCM10914_593 [Paenibacillus sp. JCM 10914]